MFAEYEMSLYEFNNKFIQYFGDGDYFSDILNYSIAEGKRIRPIILIETYQMLSSSKPDDSIYNFAIALELIHNYSLIHDDLPAMDNDDYRRGRLTLHKKFSEDMAILAGDALLNTAYEILLTEISQVEYGESCKLFNISKAAYCIAYYAGIKGMIGGQVMDVLESSSSLDDIVKLYKGKTCGLIMAATTSAAYLANCDKQTIKDMNDLGFAIGMAFQLQDDLLDIDEDRLINKKTYATYSSEKTVKDRIIEYSDQAIGILSKYENNNFLVSLTNSLIKRDY